MRNEKRTPARPFSAREEDAAARSLRGNLGDPCFLLVELDRTDLH